jgi:hypothetical protein
VDRVEKGPQFYAKFVTTFLEFLALKPERGQAPAKKIIDAM